MESLPNEILLKIVKMAAKTPKLKLKLKKLHYDHSFLLHVAGKISTRHRSIARLPELWRKNVVVTLHDSTSVRQRQSGGYEDIKELLGSETELLQIKGEGNQTVDILDLAQRCQNLELMGLRGLRISKWPLFLSQWTSMRFLHIAVLESPFEGIKQLHQILPNLVTINISSFKNPIQIVLPSMNNCKKLRRILLKNGVFCFANDPRVQNPLPNGLRQFCVKGAIFTNGKKVLSEGRFCHLMGGRYNEDEELWYRKQCKIKCERYGVMNVFQDYVSHSDPDSETEDQGENENRNYIPQKAIQG